VDLRCEQQNLVYTSVVLATLSTSNKQKAYKIQSCKCRKKTGKFI